MEKRFEKVFLTAILLFLMLPTPTLASFGRVGHLEKQKNGVILRFAGGYLNVRFFSDSIIHVQFSKNPRFFKRKTLDVVGKPDSKVHWTLETKSSGWDLHGDRVTVLIDAATGKVCFCDPSGIPILVESDHQMEPATIQGEKTFHVRQQWRAPSGESLYGLGERQLGNLDIKGYDLDLWQHNTNAVVPFLVSSLGYGVLWENTAFTRFGDLGDFVPIPTQYLLDKNGRPGGLTARLEGPSVPESQTAVLDFQSVKKPWDDQGPAKSWEGFFQPPINGDYQLKCRSNGGIKVWLDGKLIMDHWRQFWLTADEQVKLHLEGGKKIPLRIEWDTDQGTTFHFLWKPPSNSSLEVTEPKPIMIDTAVEKINIFPFSMGGKPSSWSTPQTLPDITEKNLQPNTSLWSEVGDGIDYYFVYGPQLNKVVSGYRTLTGPAPLMPAWAFGLWQSRQRYETDKQSLDVVDGFRKRRIPFDNIVQDWMYWRKDSWGSHQFDPDRFPDPGGWLKSLHEKHAHVMISVWPKFYPGTDNFKTMKEKGFLYPLNLEENYKDWIGQVYTFYDAFSPAARKLFWRQINTGLFQKGVDAWWLDASEPDLTASPPIREEVMSHMNPTALGSGARMLLGYPLLHSQGIYEGQRTAAPNQRVFILTRCVFSGQQRNAAAVWSGDVSSTWTALAKQIPAGLGFSLSGMPYWTTDTGGYTMQWKFSPENPKPKDEEEWRELNARWFEFSTFCPILRVHGEQRPREMWTLGGEDSPAYKAELKFDRLRYRMFSYLYSTAWAVTKEGETFMRPLVMDFPSNTTTRDSKDEYMFGHAFLVAPVTSYKGRSREVYLPPGTVWYDFWTGRSVSPGSQEVSAPYDSIPLYVRAGSIIPFGPEIQYIGEKPQDPITLYVYAGADGDFTLYEDDGLTYDYEKGAYSEIPIHWDNASQTLTFGERKGNFDGMLEKRTFNIVLVTKDKPVGFSFEPKSTRSVNYNGEKASAFFGK